MNEPLNSIGREMSGAEYHAAYGVDRRGRGAMNNENPWFVYSADNDVYGRVIGADEALERLHNSTTFERSTSVLSFMPDKPNAYSFTALPTGLPPPTRWQRFWWEVTDRLRGAWYVLWYGDHS